MLLLSEADALYSLPCRWFKDCIVVMEEVVVHPPYKIESCQSEVKSALAHVQKVVRQLIDKTIICIYVVARRTDQARHRFLINNLCPLSHYVDLLSKRGPIAGVATRSLRPTDLAKSILPTFFIVHGRRVYESCQ
jgi:hypothetical protein